MWPLGRTDLTGDKNSGEWAPDLAGWGAREARGAHTRRFEEEARPDLPPTSFYGGAHALRPPELGVPVSLASRRGNGDRDSSGGLRSSKEPRVRV
jgi:hypothetical protein